MKYFMYAATISTLAIVSATSAKANDEVEAATAEGETIIVTAERVARANNVVEKADIEALSGGENIVNAIRTVPGVHQCYGRLLSSSIILILNFDTKIR